MGVFRREMECFWGFWRLIFEVRAGLGGLASAAVLRAGQGMVVRRDRSGTRVKALPPFRDETAKGWGAQFIGWERTALTPPRNCAGQGEDGLMKAVP
jgi:hypothetical protein